MRRKWGFAALALALALCIAGAVFAEDSPLFKAGPYAVRYMANGGTNAPADQIKQHGVPLTLSSQQPVREGYTFVSWNTVADGSGTSWAPGATYTANANLTLYAIWSRVTYTITYNANGGTGAPVPQTKNAGEAVNLSTVIPTRNGYAFLHWNTTSTGSGKVYMPGALYEDEASVTLFAIWQPRTYTIRYDANGGFGAPPDQQKQHGTPLTLTSVIPHREGYTFLHWNTAADGSGASWAPGASFTVNADTLLYAIWQPITYTVSYNANGGTFPALTQTKTHGVPLILTAEVPTRNGYTFVSWNTAMDGSGTTYKPGGTYTADANVTLFAIWQRLTWAVRYNANGGTGAPADQTKEWGVTLILSSDIPTRSGFTFVEWNTAEDGSGASYAPGAAYTREEAVTLYAQWQRITYLVTYNPGAGSGGPTVQVKEAGVPLKLSEDKPTRNGFTFVCWNTSAAGTGTSYEPGELYFDDTNLNLFAIWKRLTYTVYYNANGGTGAPVSQTKEWGVALTLSSETPQRNGYSFQNWNTRADGSGTNYAPGASYTVDESVTLFAVWSKIQYTVTYNANGGTGAPPQQHRSPGETLILSTAIPTRVGYVFVEWNTVATGGGTSYQPGDVYTADASVTLFAIWQAREYIVSYDANGGETAPMAQKKIHGTALTLTSDLPTRTGWTFASWNTRSDGSGTSYMPGGSYTTEADVTLYAIWNDRTVTLTYNANGGTGAPPALTVSAGTTVTVSYETPHLTGSTFVRWNTRSDGSGASYMPGDTLVLNDSLTLFAIWKTHKVTLIYETFGADNTPDPVTVAEGDTVVLSTMIPTRNGYVFSHWNTEHDGTGASYAPGASFTLNTDLTLFAIWTKSLFRVSYDANGGTNAPPDQEKALGVPLTLTDALPLWEGHSFVCWNTSPAGTGTSYFPGGAYAADADVTLYAVWNPHQYTITYDANGGTGAPAPQTKSHGVTLYLSTVEPTRAGCTFARWATSPDGSGISFHPGQGFTLNKDTTLFAIWDPQLYTIHFDANGGTNAPADQQKLHGASITLSSQKPERTGYDFVTWCTDKGGAGTDFLPGAVFSLDADTTLFAQWTPAPPSPPSMLTLLETSLVYSVSPDGKSIFMNQPTVLTSEGPCTFAYNCYDDGGSAVNYYYSGANRTAMSPGRNGRFNVYCVVNDGHTSVTIATGWVKLTGYGGGALQVSETSASWTLSPDKHSIFIDKPTISGGSGSYKIAYVCYDDHSNSVNYYYSTANRTAMTPGYPGRFCVYVTVSDGVTSVTINTGWVDVY